MKQFIMSLFTLTFLAGTSVFAQADRPCGDGSYTAKPIVKLSYMGFTVCSVIPLAYVTVKQAIEAGSSVNTRAASEACESGHARLGQISKPSVKINTFGGTTRPVSAAILQKFNCRLK